MAFILKLNLSFRFGINMLISVIYIGIIFSKVLPLNKCSKVLFVLWPCISVTQTHQCGEQLLFLDMFGSLFYFFDLYIFIFCNFIFFLIKYANISLITPIELLLCSNRLSKVWRN